MSLAVPLSTPSPAAVPDAPGDCKPLIYLDNAATTPLEPLALAEMMPFLANQFGNASSLHSYGRTAKVAIEKARKSIAGLMGTSPAQIFFTSGGTEADNTAIVGAVRSLGVHHIITSAIEHHAVLHTAEALHRSGQVGLSFVALDTDGNVDMAHLEALLLAHSTQAAPALVSLMHGNNEIGNLADLQAIGTLVRQHHGYFHSDTVQTVGHFPFQLQEIPVDFIAAAAHKFHGPKGNGFLYMSDRVRVEPFIYGGAQERNMRGGTENVAGIVGMAKALEVACGHMETHAQHIRGLKREMIRVLADSIDDLQYNGRSADVDGSLYTVLSLSLPPNANNEMLLFRLDIAGICASGGSACSSGAQGGSHVLNALYPATERTGVRFSFSKYNTEAEVRMAANALAEIVGHKKQPEPILA